MNKPSYRAWHTANKTMHEVAVIDCTNGNLVTRENYRAVEYEDPPVVLHIWERFDRFILMQSTELRDLIVFQDDILFYKEFIELTLSVEQHLGRIFFDEKSLSWKIDCIKCKKTHGLDYVNNDHERYFEFKILGSIHQNPELLKGERK